MSTMQMYGSWPVHPTLHEPTASLLPERATLERYATDAYADLGVRFLDTLGALGVTDYRVGKNGPVTSSTISNIRHGRQKPSIELITWLVNVYPQVNLDYLFREEGEPIKQLPELGQISRLTTDEMGGQIKTLIDRLRTEVYPALTDSENLIYKDGEIAMPSDRALAINLHREFVEALGPHQTDWWGAYWKELGWLFEQLFGYAEQCTYLLTDRVFLQLIRSFAA
ncbi:XRE family transcriptional regulator [Fibrella sp. ES10-3-2-2]|nr:hypothetical protein A6C57_01070 [Fibrella sp. ES10-3-2-2]